MLDTLSFHCLHKILVFFSWKGTETKWVLNLDFLHWFQRASLSDWTSHTLKRLRKAFCASVTGGASKLSFKPSVTLEEVQKENPQVVKGRYRPVECSALQHVAILIPHRNREKHLLYLLQHLHPFLQRQQLDYGIYVIHQVRVRVMAVPCSLRRGFCCLCCLTSVLRACFQQICLLRDAVVPSAIAGGTPGSRGWGVLAVSLTAVLFSVQVTWCF